jgi:predicted naringenin-chalcone synthase
MRARLLGLGTVPAPHRLEQKQIARFLGRVAAEHTDPKDRETVTRRIHALSDRSAIETRNSVLSDYHATDPADFRFYPQTWKLDPFPTTADRMRVYEHESLALAADAATRALADADVHPKEITHLVLSTCTGLFAPGPDVLLFDRLGLRRDVERTVIGFMGCYAGFAAMRTADRIARAEPGAHVLTVAVELCSLHFQRALDTETLIANTLFSDGAAAAIWASSDQRAKASIRATRSRVPAGTLDKMSWRIGDHGFVMTLDGEVPRALEQEAPPFLRDLLRDAELDRDRVQHFAVHPGGKKILDSVSRALGSADLSASRAVLREHGNMSSATIFFVLEKLLAQGTGPIAALGFGPGLSMEGLVLDR